MLAVIKTGGKQYVVEPGQKLKVEKLDVKEGKDVIFSEVLLVQKNKQIEIGNPIVKGAKVTAKFLDSVKGEKLIIFKYKAKKRYQRKVGHRQNFTEVKIISIDSASN